ncbi:MAG: helix-turn-helix domain-containing protein [Candidatus Dojkabacteria bacterium]|nr:helix-turn-helix domain-containing protein [Candidatus Dojkabacteria bacterium]MDQ7020643.1 helix-turn-helix domain-containing protein [Candidatus Dojkabacteria bacterium]
MIVYINKQILIEKLKELSLDSDEASLYLHLYEHGEQTPLEISRDTNINRSKIYRITESLKGKKIIEETESAWGKKLSAAPAENLELIITEAEQKIKTQKDVLNDLIQDLKDLKPIESNSFSVKYYSGLDGVKQVLWNELHLKKVYSFSHGMFNDVVREKFANKIRKEYVTRKIELLILENQVTTPDKQNLEYYEHNFTSKVINTKILDIQHMIDICDDTIAIID